MYNTDMPTRAELPTTPQLLRSTLIALVTAAVLLVTVVLPAEYAVDPTGVGKMLGLTQMGEIKQQLASEAEAEVGTAAPPPWSPARQSQTLPLQHRRRSQHPKPGAMSSHLPWHRMRRPKSNSP